MNLRALIYQNLHEQKLDLKTALLRQLEAESHKDELELKATNSTIDFEKCDLPAPMRLGRDQQPELIPDAGAADDVAIERTNKTGKNQKRLKILNGWYLALCIELEGNIEAINQKIDGLKNQEIKNELSSITPNHEKYLWANGADRWIMNNGKNVWKFKRTQGWKT